MKKDRQALLEEEVERVAQTSSWLNERGQEMPSNVPVEVPLRFRTPSSTSELIKEMVRRELSQAAQAQGFETWEEADDFDCEDEEDWQVDPLTGKLTEYERTFEGALPSGSPGEPVGEPPEGGSGGPPPASEGAGGSPPAAGAPSGEPSKP